jgi:hypothetical protein
MRILMTNTWRDADYLSDMLLHGLRSLYGTDVVDYPRMDHMYADTFGEGGRDIKTVAANGFSLYARYSDDGVDRSDIQQKIIAGYWDLIIMQPWYTSALNDLILEHTPLSKIAWVDGRDERQLIMVPFAKGNYFKRELHRATDGVNPISFAIPAENIRLRKAKKRAIAHIIPGQPSTYIYDREDDYYDGYNTSLFGVTFCKNGWDCLRHYEILAARCVPWFMDIGACPDTTCTTLPKSLLIEVDDMITKTGFDDGTGLDIASIYDRLLDDGKRMGLLNDYMSGSGRQLFDNRRYGLMHGKIKNLRYIDDMLQGPLRQWYDDMAGRMHDAFVSNCTTEVLGKYVISTVQKVNR